MRRTLSRSFVVFAGVLAGVLAAALAQPAAALAQPAPASTAATDGLSQTERDALAAAEQLAADTSQAMEQWLTTQAISEARLFSRMYFPIAGSDPIKFTTAFDTLADRDLTPLEDKALAHSVSFQYAIVCDLNGYVPAYNTRFSQPATGNKAQDAANSRSKRMFGDLASVQAAHNEARFLDQRVRLDSGDVMGEISVPLMVRGKHWGSVRVGFRRTE